MASGLNRNTLEVKDRGIAFNSDDPDWIVPCPDLSGVDGWDKKYWKIVGDAVQLMTQSERDDVDAAEQAAAMEASQQQAIAIAVGTTNVELYIFIKAMAIVLQRRFHSVYDALGTAGSLLPRSTVEELTAELIAEIQNG